LAGDVNSYMEWRKIERIVSGPLASTTAAAVSLMVSGAARVCRYTRAGGGLVQVRD
jgi:hypothetical protein